uniref:Transposon protein, putative, CACTA, En/Spm sub-class n=2 Tax=Oryza sativa subsp. japonica TaxID=39947 RepID=Q8S6U7_ORYSJ|nr:Putative retrotransposable elements TNP2 [Oryza sativa Japonica Group]ABB47043.2 transposon protein, putative, CACTA, En/Spm sub-class [Oryza sativa Japonica Group]
MSTTTSGSSRARTPRTGNKIPKEWFRITAVDAVGLPTSPRKILSRFRSICGVIGRQKFSILQDDFKLVPAAEKDIVWLTFKESFDYPAEHEDHLRRAAFKVMGTAWKNFKTKLVGEFVYNPANPDPREKFPWITEQVWEEFHAKKSTPESRARSEAYRLLQTRNQHPHRLGTAGYAEDQRVYEAIKKLVAEQQASQEACSQRREDNLLTKALGNKEHRGRTRGVGSSVPWKYGFPDYAWQYKKRTSNKAEKDARLEANIRESIRAELTFEFDEKLESMRAKIRQEIREEQQIPQAAAAAAHKELGSPTEKRSSCASTELTENPTSVDSAVDYITEPTSCTLTVRVMPTFTVPAAEGLAYKPTPETRVHGAQLRADCAKVQVDSVKPEYELFPLKYPPNDEVLSLGNARGTFIQWPKDLIEIRVTARPTTAPGSRPPKRPASAPSAPPAQDRHAQFYDVQLQYDTDFGEDRTEADSKAIHEPPPMKKSRKAHSSPQRITLDKPEAKGRGRGGKVQASLLAPRKLDLGKGQEETKGKEVKKKYVAPQEFQLGMPLVGDDVLATMGTACKDLHLYYMEKSNARKPSKATDILGQHDGKPFLGPTNYIVVDFKDLFDLYRLRAVDTSLPKCYSFAHWILLVITPKWSTCHYLNSRIDKNAYDWTPIQLEIDEAWAQYVQRGGLRKTGHDTLIHKKDFSVKQQIGDQCGFYVCHNMRLLYREKVKTLAEFEAMMNTYYATVMM